jgi:hypothetical protein
VRNWTESKFGGFVVILVSFLNDTGYYFVAQAGLKLLDSKDPPASAFQVAGTTGTCHHTWQRNCSNAVCQRLLKHNENKCI